MSGTKATKGMGPEGRMFSMKPGQDNGYTAICPTCCERHDERKELIKKERYLRFEKCPKCNN